MLKLKLNEWHHLTLSQQEYEIRTGQNKFVVIGTVAEQRLVEQPTRHATNKHSVLTLTPIWRVTRTNILIETKPRREEKNTISQTRKKTMKATKSPIHAVTKWLRRQPPKMKVFLAILSGLAALVFLRMIVHDHDKLFVAAEFVHALGVALLIYKLAQEKTCAGKYVSTTFLFLFTFWNLP